MEKTALETIRRHAMLPAGGDVIVALSGGADSVALFHFLYTSRERLGIQLFAAHFEHGMRGEESIQDAAFVRELCEKHGVKLYYGEGGMRQKEHPKGISGEEWARRLRYDFLEGLAEAHSAKVATAHTQNDNAETILFNAVRGAGPRGLSGIPPVRGPFIRPLLDVSREEVEAYCAGHGLAYVTDSTNRDVSFSRNRLRHQVLPALEQVHGGAVASLARLGGDMREIDAWLEGQARQLLAEALEPALPEAAAVPMETMLLAGRKNGYLTAVLQAAPLPVLRKALALLAGPSVDRPALARMEAVLRGDTAATQLSGGKTLVRAAGRLWMKETNEEPDKIEGYEHPLALGTIRLPGGYTLTLREAAAGEEAETKKTAKKRLTFLADYDKIFECGAIRTRRAGDSFAPAGRGLTKSLKKWMNEEGIPLQLRGGLPLIANGNDVLWIWGGGVSQKALPGNNTRRLLCIDQWAGD